MIIPMVGSLYSGFCLYINGMVADMKTKIAYGAFGSDHKPNGANLWAIYVEEINFHNEIIRYEFDLTIFGDMIGSKPK